MYPVFLSVSSNDEKFARSIWEGLPRDWAYLYSMSGEEGAELWDEISRCELPSSKYLIVFWSKDYVTAGGCIRELRQAAELVASGTLSPLILRLDEFPITWSDHLSIELKAVFSDLARLLGVRTSRPNITVDDASHIVQRFIEPGNEQYSSHIPPGRNTRHDAIRCAEGAVQVLPGYVDLRLSWGRANHAG